MTALAKPTDAAVFRVPDDRVLAMIQGCAEQIAKVQSIPDAQKAVDVAEAIAAISRKVKLAEETKRAAIRLLASAEAALGQVLRSLPKQRAGDPNAKPKRDILVEHGINKRRASNAERLATTPRARIDEVIDGGARTLHGITAGLGLHANGYDVRAKRASEIAFLCDEAVGLLDRCVKAGKVPHSGTVAEMVARLRSIKAHGNLST